MKRAVSMLLAAVLLTALAAPAGAASPYDFEKINSYMEGQFADVPAGSRWADNVRSVYEVGLMAGVTDTRFDTEGSLTIIQTVAMACRLHSAYCGEGTPLEEMVEANSGAWYQPYVVYADSHEMASREGIDDINADIARGDFAWIMWAAVPDEALAEINSVEDGAIPDVPITGYYAAPVYALYRAGILTGNDAKGTFTPESTISRGAAAAIISRIADSSLRRPVTLTKAAFQPVAMQDLANLKSIQKKATDQELAQAYDEALALAAPYAGMALEDQLMGIAVSIRERFEQGMSYSMETEHYNDPYGYFILGSASCAGCTRATGLCLNILGIPYEHVNENQYSHQWCRVKVGDTYWICDAYGLYCGPEPAPYAHPYM